MSKYNANVKFQAKYVVRLFDIHFVQILIFLFQQDKFSVYITDLY